MFRVTIKLFIVVLVTGCFQKKTYLSEDIRNFVPYKEGQKLTFISSNNITSTLTITEVRDNRFPDGLGAPKNEILTIYSTLETTDLPAERKYVGIITALAKWRDKEEEIIFEIILGKAAMRHRVPFSKVQGRRIETLVNGFNQFNDVITLQFDYEFKVPDHEITQLYWSKSNGYVRLVQHDGTFWDLKSIESR